MGVVRTVEWSLSVSPAQAERRIRDAMASLGMDAQPDGASIRATSTRSMMKNRWAADVSVDLSPMGAG